VQAVAKHRDRRTPARRAQKFPRAISLAVDVQRLVGDDPLEALVLALKLPQALDVVGLHPAELVAPAVIGVLRDAELLRDLSDRLLLGEHPVGIAQLADDLLGSVPRALHRDRPCSPIFAGA
jgi:hypothetical protein